MRKNKLKKLFKEGKAAINGWIEIPSSYSAEAMAHQGWDSLTIDLQHGAISQSDILQIFQAISTTEVVPMARLNWNEPDQIMKALDYGAYGIICPMVSNRNQAEKFVQACMYPPKGYRSFGPTRGFMYGGNDYVDHANDEILKIAMIETKEALNELDKIMKTPDLDGVYIGPSDLSLSIGEKAGFDKPEGHQTYEQALNTQLYALLSEKYRLRIENSSHRHLDAPLYLPELSQSLKLKLEIMFLMLNFLYLQGILLLL